MSRNIREIKIVNIVADISSDLHYFVFTVWGRAIMNIPGMHNTLDKER